MANEEIPSFWHLRETQALVEWLRGRGSRGSSMERLSTRMGGLNAPPTTGTTSCRQAIEEHALETGGDGDTHR